MTWDWRGRAKVVCNFRATKDMPERRRAASFRYVPAGRETRALTQGKRGVDFSAVWNGALQNGRARLYLTSSLCELLFELPCWLLPQWWLPAAPSPPTARLPL